MTEAAPQVDEQVARLADRLSNEYADSVPPGVVRSLVSAAYEPLREARVTQFVPVLVDRDVRARLRVRR